MTERIRERVADRASERSRDRTGDRGRERRAARGRDRDRLDQPREAGLRIDKPRLFDAERFGRASEAFARWMGTAQFLIYMTVFVAAWLAWNTFMPEAAQFDPRSLNYTLLTLILSLQASYAAPLILLAQNRQDDRDRVGLEQDRARDERNLADTEFLTREVAALRIAMRDMATRDYLRSELRDLLEELENRGVVPAAEPERQAQPTGKVKKAKKKRPVPAAGQAPATTPEDAAPPEAEPVDLLSTPLPSGTTAIRPDADA
ncbi:DUF1003 domain-containing protein [Arsenicicoccus dermatophilus]|uniref:DUF1003 domain-containing protein n=1 Tax=Arsenicicoccus dermatophilus TaxID=1076331 RepID=UPI001F4C63C0|nr:DUF1003 domain-containing protein [Arsenicicoccus dermatophilus]MCH8613669.1 DUF1003 domain-containing protein [Arsenicicoccus dermatophilus]